MEKKKPNPNPKKFFSKVDENSTDEELDVIIKYLNKKEDRPKVMLISEDATNEELQEFVDFMNR